MASSDNKDATAVLGEITRKLFASSVRLMQHYHTGKIEAVPVAWLRPWPMQEIPTP
jgi:hypothetical protein